MFTFIGRVFLAVVFRDLGVGGEKELLTLGILGSNVIFTVFCLPIIF